MSFSFGFSGDDIEPDLEQVGLAGLGADSVPDIPEPPVPRPLLLPKRHGLQEILSSLPSRLSFNLLKLPYRQPSEQRTTQVGSGKIVIPRRALFDVRAQLMAEADAASNKNDAILAGLQTGDLTTGIYEGGFKTWECALDLASWICEIDFPGTDLDFHIIELGAGSAVPSMAILSKILETAGKRPEQKFHFSLCDYNEDVLRLVTAPNVFLNGLRSQEALSSGIETMDDDLDLGDIDEKLVSSFMSEMEKQNISFSFFSGGWSTQLCNLIRQQLPPYNQSTQILVLASETIYSPDAIGIFTETLTDLLWSGDLSKGYLAAKSVYFGVGGGIDEFQRELLRTQKAVYKRTSEVRTEGVGRVILEITPTGTYADFQGR